MEKPSALVPSPDSGAADAGADASMDAPVVAPDAGGADSSTSVDASGGTESAADAGGCGCSAPGGSQGTGAWLLALAGLWAAGWRRR